MAGDIQIRTVRVELLRAGPAHNQLLSPLTAYLGVCDDSDAGLVNVPFEQHVFDRRMRAMRHERLVGDEGQQPPEQDHLPDLRDLGVAMARLLGAVPRLPGSLTGDPGGRDTLVRLSLTLSAAELAGLPFELAKVPIGPDSWTESWLSLQSKVPVVITRRTRNASAANVGLAWLKAPRILFVSAGAAGDSDVPFDAHLQALLDALAPFVPPDAEGRRRTLSPARTTRGGAQVQTLGRQLTVLSRATLDSLMHECSRAAYTHVHVLAHGTQDDRLGDRKHGLMLSAADGMISGERLASALAGVVQGRLHRPQVVTLATCDSGNPGPVVYPGASIAHALHQTGIPLVVASQVPLTFEGSTLLAREFYTGLLWGEHPWVLLHRVRTSLHGRQKPDDHDWASVVVYESLPVDMDDALESAALRQCERALDVATANADANGYAPPERLGRVIQDLVRLDGRYAMEALALRAEARMRSAWQDAFDAYCLDGRRGNKLPADDAKLAEHLRQRSLSSMEQALADYERAVEGFLVNPGQGLNAPFRALLAQMAIRLVVYRQFDFGTWSMALHWADCAARMSPDPSQKVWALGCMALLHLIGMADPAEKPSYHARQAELAGQRVREMALENERTPDRGAVQWVGSQLTHFRDWFADPGFQKVVLKRRGGPLDLRELPRKLHAVADELQQLLAYLASYVGPDAAEPEDEATAEVPPPAAPAAPATPAPPAPAAAAPSAAPVLAHPATGEAFLDLEMLPVAQGDCLWLEWGLAKNRWRLLVDCGTEGSFDDALGPRIQRLARGDRRFELFILSHIDGDHIGGGIPLLQQAKALGLTFGDIWFNGRHHLERRNMLSGKDGDDFSTLLKREKLPWNLWTQGKAIVRAVDAQGREGPLPTHSLPGGMKLTLLSPVPDTLLQLAGTWDKDLKAKGRRRVLARGELDLREDLDALVASPFRKDSSRPNGSSIAVLLEFAGKTVLLGADAYADVLASAITKLLPPGQRRLRLDAFKVSHHGSRGNVNDELMALIDCEHHLISTSGAVFKHPDREALARYVRRSPRPVTLWFNHPLPDEDHDYHAFWARADVQRKWNFQARHPAQPGQTFSLRWAPAKPASA